jgi:hypothetical protein
MLPTGGERHGELWRWGDELYIVQSKHDTAVSAPSDPGQNGALPHTLRWHLASAAPNGTTLFIELRLHDALIATHVQVRIELERPGWSWPWLPMIVRQRLASITQVCRLGLELLLREQALAPLALEAATSPVQTPVAVSAAVGEQSREINRLLSFERQLAPVKGRDPLAERLRSLYPQTVAQFEAMDAFDHLERIWRLEQGWERIMAGVYDASCYSSDERRPADANPQLDYDLIYAGGGLSLFHASVMAQRYGWRVMVFDHGQVGCVHREWNISRAELLALINLGIVTWEELDDVIMREYRNGLVRFHTGPNTRTNAADLCLPEVLNLAIDAGALLGLLRRKIEAAGGTILNHRAFRRVRVATTEAVSVSVDLETLDSAQQPQTVESYTARLLLDGMGSISPLALHRHAGRPFAGVCPTVGTVAQGFAQGSGPREYDPTLGEILISLTDAQQGRQLMWEGFPGRGDDLTVYLFYYATLGDQRPTRGKLQHLHNGRGASASADDPIVCERIAVNGNGYAAHNGQPNWAGLFAEHWAKSELASETNHNQTPSLSSYQPLVTTHVSAGDNTLPINGDRWSPADAARATPTEARTVSYSLLDLFERYFTLLPSYKEAGPDFHHVKPVYGYIPARHSLRQQEAPLLRGVLPVGDSAAQQSPLTFCGFGSHVRNLDRTTSLLDYALRCNLVEPRHLRHISAFQTNVSLNWIFSRFMQPWNGPSDVNELQNVFLAAVCDLGEAAATRFFQDRMRWSDYHLLMLGIRKRYRKIWPVSLQVIGREGVRQWVGEYLRFTYVAGVAALARRGGSRCERAAYWLTERVSPALSLHIRSWYAEWRAMGWV